MIYNREFINASVTSAAWNGLTQLPRFAFSLLAVGAAKATGSGRIGRLVARQSEIGLDGIEATRFYRSAQQKAFLAGLATPLVLVAAAIGYAAHMDDAPSSPPIVSPAVPQKAPAPK